MLAFAVLAAVLGAATAGPTPAAAADPVDHRLWTVGSQSDGWYIRNDGQQPTQRWVSPECRVQLESAGIAAQRVPYTRISALPRQTPWPTCGAIVDELAGGGAGDAPVMRFTAGTNGRSTMTYSSVVPDDPATPYSESERSHGVRIYCPVSHFSYDDPVVHPRRPGAAHLHMYWGNTSTDAFSNGASLLNARRTSCEGGTDNLSAYWSPTVFNQRGEAVVPEEIVVYYKSFGHDGFDRNTIRPIPNGLQMLADKTIPGVGNSIQAIKRHGSDRLELKIAFPTCVETEDGRPVLVSQRSRHVDPANPGRRNLHLAYAVGETGGVNGCPASHPYRIPQLSYNIRYDIGADEVWSLASDPVGGRKGASLHADYIAAWARPAMDRIVHCNKLMMRECEFTQTVDGVRVKRTQLVQRFFSPTGQRLYTASTRLAAGTDRTPYGARLPRMWR